MNRSVLPTLPEDEQNLNQVLNSLGTHSLVIETQQDNIINDVGPQDVPAMSIAEGQMLQDSLNSLDNELLLQSKLLSTTVDGPRRTPDSNARFFPQPR